MDNLKNLKQTSQICIFLIFSIFTLNKMFKIYFYLTMRPFECNCTVSVRNLLYKNSNTDSQELGTVLCLFTISENGSLIKGVAKLSKIRYLQLMHSFEEKWCICIIPQVSTFRGSCVKSYLIFNLQWTVISIQTYFKETNAHECTYIGFIYLRSVLLYLL